MKIRLFDKGVIFCLISSVDDRAVEGAVLKIPWLIHRRFESYIVVYITLYMIHLIELFRPGTEIEILLCDYPIDAKLKYYSGVVKQVHGLKVDSGRDKYIDCDVLYSDGEFVENASFGLKDFNKNEYCGWRFVDIMIQSIALENTK